jgi:hypothetical protein
LAIDKAQAATIINTGIKSTATDVPIGKPLSKNTRKDRHPRIPIIQIKKANGFSRREALPECRAELAIISDPVRAMTTDENPSEERVELDAEATIPMHAIPTAPIHGE